MNQVIPRLRSPQRGLRWALALTMLGAASLGGACAHDADNGRRDDASTPTVEAKKPPTYLWRITAPGAEGPSAWLLGSVHVTLKDSKLDAVLHRAFEQADGLAVEIDIDKVPVRELTESFTANMNTGGPDLEEQLGPKDFARLQALLAQSGVLLPDLKERQPWAVSVVLARITPMRGPGAGEGLEVGVDRYFTSKARAKGLEVHSLETVEEQVSALASASPRLQLQDLRASMKALEAGVSPARAVVESYFAGTLKAEDVGGGAKASTKPTDDVDGDRAAYHRRVFTDRNVTMAERIQGLLQKGRRPFIIVGAGHLLGEQSIPALLREAGYSVEAVPASGEMIAVQLPEDESEALPTAVVVGEDIPWPTAPRQAQMKVGGGTQVLHIAFDPPLRYVLTRAQMPRSLLTSLRITYGQAVIAQEGQLNAKTTRQEPAQVGGLEATYFEQESEAMWFAVMVVWADGIFYNFAAIASLDDATAEVREQAEAVLRRFSLSTLTVEEVEARAQKIGDVLAERPAWLYPFERCPLESMKKATLPPKPKTHPCKDPERCLEPCVQGNGWLCMELADQLSVYGAGSEQVEPLYARSCRLGFIEGCDSQASEHFMNDEAEALWGCAGDTFALGCESGDPWGCLFTGRAYAAGRGAEKDIERAVTFFEQSCVPMGEEHPACRAARRTLQALERMNAGTPEPAAPEPAESEDKVD